MDRPPRAVGLPSIGPVLGALILVLAGMAPPLTGRAAAAALIGAGDIGRCDSSRDEATAPLGDRMIGRVFTRGGNADPSGSPTPFEDWYVARQLRKFQTGVRGRNPEDAIGLQMSGMAMTVPPDSVDHVAAYVHGLSK